VSAVTTGDRREKPGDEAREAVRAAADLARRLTAEIGRALVGQHRLVDRLLVGLIADGHILLEGLPGLAKTLSVRTLAAAVNLSFQRVQFTPDLLPADLVGTLVYNPADGRFNTHHGPIFANVVLADEVNRAPARVQSALLEAMQERQVTLGKTTYPLPEPFLVLATQNPIEHEGTYPLPEAQLDRFLFHVVVTYPARAEELEILKRGLTPSSEAPRPVADAAELLAVRRGLAHVAVDDKITSYVLDLIQATRQPAEFGLPALAPMIRYGASPRAAVHLVQAARAHALLSGRTYVLPEDVRDLAPDVLRHRVLLTYDAEAQSLAADAVIAQLLAHIRVP
jgi:MoxR-like ATPase